jgi:hypothetical protein
MVATLSALVATVYRRKRPLGHMRLAGQGIIPRSAVLGPDKNTRKRLRRMLLLETMKG